MQLSKLPSKQADTKSRSKKSRNYVEKGGLPVAKDPKDGSTDEKRYAIESHACYNICLGVHVIAEPL